MKQITEFTKPLDLMYFLSRCENINGVNYIAKDDFLSHVKELREENENLKKALSIASYDLEKAKNRYDDFEVSYETINYLKNLSILF